MFHSAFALLANFDLFKLPVIFYFNGKSTRSSNLGILCSFGILMFLSVTFFQSDLFAKKSPIVVTQSLQIPHANKITFDNNTLILFSVSDASNKRYIDPSIFTIQVKNYHVKANGFGVNEYISNENSTMKPCSVEDMSFNPLLFEKMGLKNAFCFENKSFELEGFWDEHELKYISVNLLTCDNSTSNNTCKDSAAIENFFTNPYKFFVTEFHTAQIDLYDYENPFKISYQVEYQFIDPKIMKRFNIHLKNAEVATDDGWIFPVNKIQNNMMFAKKEFDFQSRIDTTSAMFSLLFYASKEKVFCSRRYQKLPETLGSLTGMAHLIMFSCKIVTKVVIHIMTLRQVLNRLFVFPEIKSSFSKKIKKKSKLKSNENSKENIAESIVCAGTNIFTKNPNFSKTSLMLDTVGKEQSKSETNINQLKSSKQPQMVKNKSLVNDDSFVLEHYSQQSTIREKPEEKNQNCKQSSSLERSHDPLANEITKLNDLVGIKKIQVSSLEKTQNMDESSKSKYYRFRSFLRKQSVVPNKSDHFTLSYWEYFCYLISHFILKNKTKKQRIIKKAESTFKSEMDVVNILTKLHDIEKLKMILLDEDQLFLFNYLKKPFIYVNENDCETKNALVEMKRLKMRTISDNSMSLKKTYDKILTKKEDSLINKRLLEFIDEKKCIPVGEN